MVAQRGWKKREKSTHKGVKKKQKGEETIRAFFYCQRPGVVKEKRRKQRAQEKKKKRNRSFNAEQCLIYNYFFSPPRLL